MYLKCSLIFCLEKHTQHEPDAVSQPTESPLIEKKNSTLVYSTIFTNNLYNLEIFKIFHSIF